MQQIALLTTNLLAITQVDTLGRSLLIAMVVVSPYGIFKIRQVRRIRERHEAALAGESESEHSPVQSERIPALEDVIRDISYVVSEAKSSGGAMLVIPHRVTVSNREAPQSVVDMLVRDSLRRSGLVVTAEIDSSEGRMLECALSGVGKSEANGSEERT